MTISVVNSSLKIDGYKMIYYAVSSGELLRCVRQKDAKSAAVFVIADALIKGPTLLEDSVFVSAVDSDVIEEFDIEEVAKNFGGIIKSNEMN